MDLEIVELNQQVGTLIEEMRSQSADAVSQAQTTTGAAPHGPIQDGLLQLLQMHGITDSPEEVLAKMKLLSSDAAPEFAAPSTPMASPSSAATGVAADETGNGEQTAASQSAARSGKPQRLSATGAAYRAKIKEIPPATLDQKAAAGRAAAGVERQERLRAARTSGESDAGDVEEDAANRLRIEEEMDQQSMA